MMEMFIQSETNMMELHASNLPKLSSSYNVELGDTNISMPISAWPLRQLSHLTCAGTSRILEDRIMRIYDENIIKIAYYDQHRYDSSDPSDNKDESVRSLVETLDGGGGGGDNAFSSRIWLWY
jgi:hypothetical protein